MQNLYLHFKTYNIINNIIYTYNINNIIILIVDVQEPKDKKPRWDQPQEVIKAVLDARQKFNEYNRGVSVNRKHAEKYVERKYAKLYN